MPSINDIKIYNTMKIMNALRFCDGLTKKDIASKTGLSFATVSNICRDLIENNVLYETKSPADEFSVGRAAMLVSLLYDRFFCVCIDMHNRKKMELAISNVRNEICAKEKIIFDDSRSLKDFVEESYNACMRACVKIGVDPKNLLGVCVAVPAIFDHQTELTVASGIRMLEGQPFKALMAEKFSVPVFIDNETNICSAAIRIRKGHATDNIIYILCSEGLGAGIITNGRQLTGSKGYASELCHIPIGSEKLVCRLCGKTRCVESDLCMNGFITKFLRFTAWNTNDAEIYWNEFLRAVERNDPHAMHVVFENAEILGKLSSILINLFDPDILYFGGEVSHLFDHMKPQIMKEISNRSNVRNSYRTLLLRDSDDDTLYFGCSEIIYRKVNFLNLNNTKRLRHLYSR